MDPGSVLDQTTHNLSNLPTELAFLLNELRERDLLFYDYRKKIQQYDSQIHKFIKANGSLVENPKEQQLYPKIRSLFAECEQLQKDKCRVANTGLYFVAGHLTRLECELRKLEKDGLFPLEDDELVLPIDSDYVDEASSQMTADTYRTANTVGAGLAHNGNGYGHKRSQSRKSNATRLSSVSAQPTRKRLRGASESVDESGDERDAKRVVKREDDSLQEINYLHSMSPGPREPASGPAPNKGDGEDQTLYCFCRQVSFGEMIACDNSKCEYEWFHYKCVGLTAEPTGKWFCPDCVKKQRKKKMK